MIKIQRRNRLEHTKKELKLKVFEKTYQERTRWYASVELESENAWKQQLSKPQKLKLTSFDCKTKEQMNNEGRPKVITISAFIKEECGAESEN